MCGKCVEFDWRIAQYRRLIAASDDLQTAERLSAGIAEMEAEKVRLHQAPLIK